MIRIKMSHINSMKKKLKSSKNTQHFQGANRECLCNWSLRMTKNFDNNIDRTTYGRCDDTQL